MKIPKQKIDLLITPDGEILEICECGDETCIEWPVDRDGFLVSDAEMDACLAERVKLLALCRRISVEVPA